MQKLKSLWIKLGGRSGMTMPELVVVVGVLGVASAILVPKLINNTDGVSDQGAINALDGGWEVGQEYYQGKRGESQTSGAPDQYNGFDAAAAWKLDPKTIWLSAPSPPLVPNKNNQSSVYIAIAGDSSGSGSDSSGNSGQILGLCSASETLIFCKYDDGFPGGAENQSNRKLGPRYGASSSSQAEALCRAKRLDSPYTLDGGTARREAKTSKTACTS